MRNGATTVLPAPIHTVGNARRTNGAKRRMVPPVVLRSLFKRQVGAFSYILNRLEVLPFLL
jgi:hypothetical protein